jgi:RimJ/RimL family protein N-acetyltransferase
VTDGLRVRRARADDVDFIVGLVNDDAVEPFLSARAARTAEDLLAEIEQSDREPEAFGRFVLELDGARAGVMGFHVENARSRIARLELLAVHPDFRGRKLADEAARMFQGHLIRGLGFHRLELEIYGFNERAMAHAERAGFVREGVRRKAYWRHDEWQDGVLYGLVADDLDA